MTPKANTPITRPAVSLTFIESSLTQGARGRFHPFAGLAPRTADVGVSRGERTKQHRPRTVRHNPYYRHSPSRPETEIPGVPTRRGPPSGGSRRHGGVRTASGGRMSQGLVW